MHIKIYFFIILLLLFGVIRSVPAQTIVINDSDSSWMGKDVPSKALAKKKFTFLRKFFQNTTTRYNYFFNTNRTLKNTIEQAGDLHKDNYDSILTLYPYQPKDFSDLRTRLDSVITNAGIGIEIHDPRSKWVSQTYLLLGKAQFYKQDYAEAIKVFRYMIRHLGKKDEENRPEIIGSREYHPEENISVMTKEEKNKKYPPARNDAFIWLIRSYLQQGKLDKVTALMSTIRADPNLPDRLLANLNIIASKFYSQTGNIKAAAIALSSAIPLEREKRLQARWQFILSQMYEHQGNWRKAIAGYHQVRDYKPDAIMKLYAALNPVLLRATHGTASYKQTKQQILTLAGKRKFSHFQSIIYLKLGRLALQTGHSKEGLKYLKKSLTFQDGNKDIHAQSSALLAGYYYQKHQYKLAKKYYDKIPLTPSASTLIRQRKEALAKIVKNIDIINREDSLQLLSKMPKDSLYALLHKKVEDSVKILKKQNLILDKGSRQQNSLLAESKDNNNFQNNNDYKGSKWYFYNEKMKANGFNKFKAQWGDRSLEDNWRLSNPNAQSRPTPSSTPNLTTAPSVKEDNESETDVFAQKYFQKLLRPIPIKKKDFNQSVEKEVEAYHKNINTFYLTLKDDSAALYTIQQLLHKFPSNNYLPDIYYKLYLTYHRMGLKSKATSYKNKILSLYPKSKYAGFFQTQNKKATKKDSESLTEQLYNNAYKNYNAGNYSQISHLRDSALKMNPQNKQIARFDLLAAMTLVKTDSGSAGVTALHQVIQDYPTDTPIIQRSKQILYSLQNKADLIAHLDSLKITKEEDSATTPPALNTNPTSTVSTTVKKVKKQTKLHKQPSKPTKDIQLHSTDSSNIPSPKALSKEVHSLFSKDSIQNKKGNISPDKEKKKTIPYQIEREVPYFVIFYFHKNKTSLLQKVEHQFQKYLKDKYASDSIQTSPYILSHNRLTLIFRTFKNEKEAISYYQHTKKALSFDLLRDIPSSYYQLFFISKDNFILMKDEEDLKGYLTFFYTHYK